MSPEDSTTLDSTATPPPKERRFKLSRACDRCRRRRIKCDEGHPCQSCLSSHSACTFEEPGKRTQHSKSKRTATLEDRMHHLETLIQSIPTNILSNSLLQSSSSSSSSTPPTLPDYPSAIPPPSLSLASLTNPSVHFSQPRPSHSYMYWDEQGCKRWQGETSGLPLLDMLFDRVAGQGCAEWAADSPGELGESDSTNPSTPGAGAGPGMSEWFPDRIASRVDVVNPETLWKVITSCIAPDLMDSLVQCYLSTTSYLMPFLHIPTFLADYSNPLKWGEPGFASFILAICCLSSRHMDDPRLLVSPSPSLAWFDLFSRLRTLPSADRPTLYTVQAVLVAAVYAVGLGKLSKAFALLSEAITLSFDAGLHRSTDAYTGITPPEDEIRKRTFWCVYMWDKQASATFGRPPLLRMRDCDVGEPSLVDDEHITLDGVGQQPPGTPSRMEAFVATVRYYILLESVSDLPLSPSPLLPPVSSPSPAHILSQLTHLRSTLPAHWAHTPDTLASEDVVRVTQAVRLHCLERFVSMLVWRGKLRGGDESFREGGNGGEEEIEALKMSFLCAREIVAAYLCTATKGLLTYYGVHVIHQLTQAGRTLVAVVLSAKAEDIQTLVAPSLEALRSCVGLLRRFSGRYVCGMRNGDLLEEFCRCAYFLYPAARFTPDANYLSQIPLSPPSPTPSSMTPPLSASSSSSITPPQTPATSRPPWLRPITKKRRLSRAQTPPAPRSTSSSEDIGAGNMGGDFLPASPEEDFLGDVDMRYQGSGSVEHSKRRSLNGHSHHLSSGSSPQSQAQSRHHFHLSHPSSHSHSSSNGSHLLTPATPELLSAELVNLLNEGSFDLGGVGMGFNGLGGIDSLWGGASGRDMGIIASP
ncbi:fungal-specific transcription factor domain-containing protein [Hysterangium stoloniferum]|nr:fungal-specific transcription factor domain-containing protein [Hysterangium stoloniferum]